MARKKRTPCPSCGANFQKGAFVWRLTPDGARRQRVCQPCSRLAVPVLASDAPSLCAACRTAHARYCAGCVGKHFERATGRKLSVRALVTK